MAEEKKYSPAFTAYKDFVEQVREGTPHTVKGDAIITVSSLKPSVKEKGDQVFYINSKSNEAVLVTISKNGVLKSASYIDKDAEEGKRATFVAKDFEKLNSLIKDPSLSKIAGCLNWEKIGAKAAEEEKEEAVEER